MTRIGHPRDPNANIRNASTLHHRSAMILYTYFRSSAAFRVRIALNLKGITAEMRSINLLAKENRQPDYRALSH
jgi:hypothetical protein